MLSDLPSDLQLFKTMKATKMPACGDYKMLVLVLCWTEMLPSIDVWQYAVQLNKPENMLP